MKSVLISIKPQWCELIASEKKTIEVRKTKPKLEPPFKVYIYCTKAKQFFSLGGGMYAVNDELYRLLTGEIKFGDSFELMADYSKQFDEDNFLNGKVIGEFVCDKIYRIDKDSINFIYKDEKNSIYVDYAAKQLNLSSCLSYDELFDYLCPKQGYGWHISNLVIYDKPKELSEFFTIKCTNKKGACSKCDIKPDCIKPITRPPQSWCYVESD